jgi:hypothetical protein
MKHKYTRSSIIAGMVAILPLGQSLAAQTPEATVTIYTDDFNRTGTLAGSTPVVGTDAPSWATGVTYTASTDLTLANNRVEVAANAGSSNAYLPVSLAPDSGIYTFTLTFRAAWHSANNWVAFGFATGTSGINDAFFSNSSGWASYSRGNDNWPSGAGVTGYLSGTTSFGSISGVNRAGATALTVSIILDTYKTTDNLTIKTLNADTTQEGAVAVRSIVGTLSEAQINSIKAIKFGSYSGQPGSFDDLSLTVTTITQVPEAGTTAAIIAFTLLGMAIVIRRHATR